MPLAWRAAADLPEKTPRAPHIGSAALLLFERATQHNVFLLKLVTEAHICRD